MDQRQSARGDGPRGDRRSGDRRSGIRARLAVVTVRGLLLSFAAALVGVVLGGFVPLLGAVGRLVGLLVAALALGVAGRGRYVEVGVAGATVGGVASVLGSLGPLLLPVAADYGVEIAGVGAGAGLLVSLVGHYLGRDLRAGLTRDL